MSTDTSSEAAAWPLTWSPWHTASPLPLHATAQVVPSPHLKTALLHTREPPEHVKPQLSPAACALLAQPSVAPMHAWFPVHVCWQALPRLHGGSTAPRHESVPPHGAKLVDECRPLPHGNCRLWHSRSVALVPMHVMLQVYGGVEGVDHSCLASALGVTAASLQRSVPAVARHATLTSLVPWYGATRDASTFIPWHT